MDPETRTDERILAAAARWHARLAAEDCTDFERAEVQRWRASDRRHAQAYETAEALSAMLAESPQLDQRLQAMTDEAFEMGSGDEPRPARFGKRVPQAHAQAQDLRTRRSRVQRWLAPALAASFVAAFIGVRLSGYLTPSTAPPVTYASSEQARRDVTLADGSLVRLDVGSEISVSFSPGRRDIVLVNGRALFEVAHDKTRPFVVAAGQSRTTALGTHFQVQREGQHVLVTLTEGSIAVASETRQSRWVEKLIPGEQVSLTTDGEVHAKRAIDAQTVTSWSRGRLVFRGTPLGEALQEVNRYGSRKVRLGDPALADLPVGGNFIAGETDLIVSAFAAALPLRVVAGSSGEIILFRRYTADGT
jgi:transmembrane sensor